MRKCLQSFIIILLLINLVPVYADDYTNIIKNYISASSSPPAYNDIDSVPWAQEAIDKLSSYYIVQGTSNGFFEPDIFITRAEFTKILISAFGLYDDNAKIELSDSTPSDWHNKYIGTAVKLGISQGVAGNSYGVDDLITREEMFLMTYRAIKSAKLSLPQVTQPQAFADEPSISEYAKDAISYLSSAQIITGYPSGEILPHVSSTRAEACVFIYNILKTIFKG